MNKDKLFILLQHAIPQAFLSRNIGKLAESKNKTIKNYLINLAIKTFEINISEAESDDINSYPTFNAFFTRKLKDGVRPLEANSSILSSPADGVLSEFGKIEDKTLIQAKKRDYSLEKLIVKSSDTNFTDFATIYLSPKDYHRVHMPIDGKLTKMVYIPGKLFSVNKTTTNNIDEIFTKNERLVCYFDTAIGEVAVIFVGALLVAGIETVWHGKVAPSYYKEPKEWNYTDGYNLEYKKGDTLGWFNFGSTVVMLFPDNKIDMLFEKKNSEIQVNQSLAKIR